jgi:hypothetical protein
MDTELLELLERLATFGEDNDARETQRPKRMLNITRDTGRLCSTPRRSRWRGPMPLPRSGRSGSGVRQFWDADPRGGPGSSTRPSDQ